MIRGECGDGLAVEGDEGECSLSSVENNSGAQNDGVPLAPRTNRNVDDDDDVTAADAAEDEEPPR